MTIITIAEMGKGEMMDRYDPYTDKFIRDTIDRQAAIDALERVKTATSENGERWIAKINAQMELEQLPPAQPEIIRCKDCAWWTKQEDSLQGRCTLLRIYPTGVWFCGNAERREVTA